MRQSGGRRGDLRGGAAPDHALRAHLAEFGVIAPQGVAHVGRLSSALEDPGSGLPPPVRELGTLLLELIGDLSAKIDGLEREDRARARQDEEAARLMTIPGIGSIGAMALQVFAPPMESFQRGRDFSAWVGLVPRQHTTGGKPRLGRISKMGQRDLRRLLITGAMAVVSWAVWRGETRRRIPGWPGCWPASRASWSPWRRPTGWRASSGR